MLGYAPNLKKDGLIALCNADGCQQTCGDVRAKVSVDRTLEMYVVRGVSVVGAAALCTLK